jgi:TolA-binding protein
LRYLGLVAACAALAFAPGAAMAQRQPPTPEQRLDRLERQIQQMQRQVFPKGRPADTAGFADEPAATQSSVVSLDQRLASLEQQMSALVRQSEENGHTLQNLQADLGRLRSDQEQRITTLEQRMNDAAAAAPVVSPGATPAEGGPPAKPPTRPATPKPSPKPSANKPRADAASTAGTSTALSATPESDPGEDAYTAAFRLWDEGQYDQAISALKAFTSAYPKHRRVSWANNLIGRALLDKGDKRAAAEALLANYRSNPAGERAPDSLYYLGQALMQLGQPGQACKAYGELDAVYPKMRADLKKQVQEAEAKAQCG